LRIGAGGGPDERFRGRIDEVRIYDTCLSAASVALVATDASITEILATPAAKRNPEHADKLRAYFLAQHAPPEIRQAQRRVLDLDAQHERLIATFPTVMVMQERKQPRPTFVLARGAYDQPGEPVSAGVPASLSARSDNGSDAGPNDRVGFARWLVDPSNPLTARVAVNRYWQMYFGTGLVKTSEDFGTQGERPSHPQLLDWLAVEFRENGYRQKELLRRIVTSETYRQSSHASAAARERDPSNRLLARGSRFRVPAETVRDIALETSALIRHRIGGPSVFPPQPPEINALSYGATTWTTSSLDDRYRRGLYTFWKRTSPYASMVAFDAPSAEVCCVRRPRSNSPLQALVLLNDEVFHEAAQAFAARILAHLETLDVDDARERTRRGATHAFRLAVARSPIAPELGLLVAFVERQRERLHGTAAGGTAAGGTASPLDAHALTPFALPDELGAVAARTDRVELAAWTALARVLLNLDETITRP